MITRRRTSFTQSEKTILSTEPAIDCNNGSCSSLAGSSTDSRRQMTPNLRKSSSGCSSWNMKSLTEVLPESPSPICSVTSASPSSSSTSSPKSDILSTQLLIKPLSTSKNQSFCNASTGVRHSRIEVDDYMKHTKHFGRFDHPNMQNNHHKGKEEISVLEEYSGQASSHCLYEDSDEGSLNALRRRLKTRPKPYSTFLDEVRKQQLEAEIESWRKAKQMVIMDRLKRKEAEISKWELKHTSKAMADMKKFESKLEKKRAKAIEKLQKRISKTNAEAHRKSAKARRETVEKIAAISQVSAKALATKNSLWIKLTRLP